MTRRARRLAKDVRLVVLTGYGQPEDQDRALEAGFDVHLVKPVDPGRLLALLAERAESSPIDSS